MQIFEANPDGTGLKQLTDSRGYNAEGSYSADGKHIVFCSNRDGKDDLERAERLVVIIAGTILTGILRRHWIFEIVLWLLAVLTNFTAVQRMLHVRRLASETGEKNV